MVKCRLIKIHIKDPVRVQPEGGEARSLAGMPSLEVKMVRGRVQRSRADDTKKRFRKQMLSVLRDIHRAGEDLHDAMTAKNWTFVRLAEMSLGRVESEIENLLERYRI